MQDAWRAYLELAMGLTEAPRKKAQDAVRRVMGSTGATAAQLQALADELRSTGAANREALTKLVRFEVERALGAVGLASADEVAELERRVRELERRLRTAAGPATASGDGSSAPATAGGGGSVGTPPTAAAAPPSTALVKKAVAKKAVAKKAVAGGGATAEATPATAVAKKTAKKAVAKKVVAKKAVAKRTDGGGGAAPTRPTEATPGADGAA
ncbi:hypothetical protein E0H26_27140 [Micromonospora zingiberis]|uniref:Polyhydroxyalkanoate synthesis regulator phasin n=1 Tax=Micromonospora zingiberis TaxID=2053011 RepID=A0A4R0G3F6_9ACTN|nr:hypothetical protein [Micromonospora zingiberis]TCB90497.1 hypothetical protein E0H26_27140 [Micromonospora zingiberis]